MNEEEKKANSESAATHVGTVAAETKKEAVILAAYHYIKKLYDNELISEKELYNVRQKYHIDIE